MLPVTDFVNPALMFKLVRKNTQLPMRISRSLAGAGRKLSKCLALFELVDDRSDENNVATSSGGEPELE